ncbi:MAG: hypothetical protein R3F37_01685, partial [Candidatus Competibacteraceae bacterium]
MLTPFPAQRLSISTATALRSWCFSTIRNLYILNGPTAAPSELGVDRINEGRYRCATRPLPMRTNDGSAEILVPGYTFYQAGAPKRNGVLVLGDANGNWLGARRIWNQWQYHVTNVNEDASIPAQEQPNWPTYNSYREQVGLAGVHRFAAPDLSVSKLSLDTSGCPAGETRISARIGNGGSRHVGAGVPVNLYNADPATGAPVLVETTTSRTLYPGDYEDVSFDCLAPPDPVFVTVNEHRPGDLIATDNLALLPHTWAQSSGVSYAGRVGVNINAFLGIDGQSNTAWTDNISSNLDERHFFEVRFPFPVNADTVTIENDSSTLGFAEGVLEFSNGFSLPVTLDGLGEGTFNFPEQSNIDWIRLTGTATLGDFARLTEFIVGGTYREPIPVINEGQGHMDNNNGGCGNALAPCIVAPNAAPQITSLPPIVALVGTPYGYAVTASDPDDALLNFALVTSPGDMTIDAAGLISWMP